MRTYILLIASSILLLSCELKPAVDTIIINANIYTVNDNFEVAQAMAIKDGKIVEVASNLVIQSKYRPEYINNAEGKTIVPGFIDAHCHFLGLGLSKQKVNLVGTKSFDEVIERIVDFQKEKNVAYITGRGWDQNDWDIKEYPTKEKLDKLFPNTPIAIRRIDGHALLANQAAIDLAGVTINTLFEGGEILKKEGQLTGVFIDMPMDLIENKIPPTPKKQKIQALLDAQTHGFYFGLTTVDDAGLSRSSIELIDSLQQSGDLKMRIYAMISNKKEDVDYYLQKGIYKTDKLNVRSVKVYADGALGSRGAALKKSYSDKHNHFGALLSSPESFKEIAEKLANSEFQMNTHAIGDSANAMLLNIYKEVLKDKVNKRWRIEHAQIVSSEDVELFKNVIPSVQPTHATSDMYWAEDRLGAARIKTAYAYKKLLKAHGKIALGTDFPVEKVSPILTFYAAVTRKDLKQFPKNGFQIENALTREEALRGMTIWAAYSNFEENEKGSLEAGKFADFAILNKNIMEISEDEILDIHVEETYVNGEIVYKK
ncbi:MAG: amidohydrolase [Flavobacteriaceae bacterium]|nr:MAG: amidohydrolase [Flavobacteriaceae bacterium]